MGRNTHSKSTRSSPLPKPLKVKPSPPPLIESVPSANISNIEGLPHVEFKKIPHVDIIPDDYPGLNALESVGAFCELISRTKSRFEANLELIQESDKEIQDLLHEAELLPATNVVDGYRFYKRIRELRIMRRVAKVENEILSPVHDYIQDNPGFVKSIKDIMDQCAKAKYHADNTEYIYRIQRPEGES